MDRADIVTMANEIREALMAAGDDVTEKRTVSGHAFLVGGRAIGQLESRSTSLRVRLWLGEKDKRAFEARPTFDAESGWMQVVSEPDVKFLRDLVPAAYKAAASGAAKPPSTGEIGGAPTSAPPGPPARRAPTRPRRIS